MFAKALKRDQLDTETERKLLKECEGPAVEDIQMKASAEYIRHFALSLFIQKAIFVY